MFKNIFNKKKKKSSKTEDVTPNVVASVEQRKSSKQSVKETKKPKQSQQPKASSKSSKSKVETSSSSSSSQIDDAIGLKHRKKKGKRPKFKKVVRPTTERTVGKVQRSKDKFFPGDVDFKYSSPKEHWVSCFGVGKEKDVDFGDSVRILQSV